jgi:FkbM family methyltransferase
MIVIPDIPAGCCRVKLDIGTSSDAPFSSLWLKNQPDLFVFGFEPLPAAIAGLERALATDYSTSPRRLHAQWKDRIHLYQVALSDVSELRQRTFFINGYDPVCSSFYKPKTGSYIDKISGEIQVNVWSLNMFFSAFFEKYGTRFECIDHVKVDAQGEDLKILKGAGKWLQEKCVYVTAEGDGYFYQGDCEECLEGNITRHMKSIGFDKVNHPKCIDPTYLNRKFAHLKDMYIQQDSANE